MFSNRKSNEGEVLRYYLVLLQAYLESTSKINDKFLNSWANEIKPLLRKKYPPIVDGIFSVNYDIEIYMEDIDKEIENVFKRKKMAEFRLDAPEKIIKKTNTKYNYHRKQKLALEEDESRASVKFNKALQKYKKTVTFIDYNKNISNIISDNDNNIKTRRKKVKRNNSVTDMRFRCERCETVINKPINNFFKKKIKKFQSGEISSKIEINKKDEIKLEYKEMTSDFKEEEEEENKNIFYNNSEKTKLKYLSTNLMLQKIILNDFIKNNLIQLYQFSQQCFSFINSEILFTKIINCYNYYKNKNTPLEKLSNLLEFINILIIEMIHYYGCIPNNNIPQMIKNFYNELLDSFKKYTTNISDITNTIQSVLFLFEIPKPIYHDLLETQRYIQFYKDIKSTQKKYRVNCYTKRESKEFLNNTTSFNMKIPKNIRANSFSVLNYEAEDIAEKLINISRTLINKIERRELYKAVYMKKDKYNTSPNVMKTIEQFNNLTFFIIEDILCYDYPKTRAKVMEKWIDIALYCIKSYDFNDYLAINVALNNYIITGLQLTFRELSKNYENKLMKMNSLCSVQGNYLEIRKLLKKIPKNTFYIPYPGILLKDLTFLEEKYKYMVGDAMINFEKIEVVQNTIDEFFNFKQSTHDSLHVPNKALFFFEKIITRSEDELEKLAKNLEPKFVLNDKMKNSKRLSMVDKKYFVENSKRVGIKGDKELKAFREQYNTVK